MPIALVTNTKRVNNDGGTTSAVDTTGATLLVACGAYFGVSGGGPGVSISDSYGNTWTALSERGPAGTRNSRIWYVANPTVGAGHTFTVTGTDSFSSVYFSAWSGVATTSPLDQNTGRNSTDGAGAYSGAVNPTEGGELVIAGWCHSSTGATASAASGWTLGDHNVATSGSDGNFGGGFAYQIQTTATNISDLTQVAVLSTSETTVSATATFKASAGGTSSMTGTITLDSVDCSGSLGLNPSQLGASTLTLDNLAPTGTLGIAPGSVSTNPFTRNTGSLPTGLTSIAVAILSDDANLTRLAGATSLSQDGGGRITYTGAGLPAVGTSVLVLTRESDGKLGVERYTVQ